jgi:hypothetical protein
LIIAPYSFFFIPYSESVPTFSSPDSKFPHHRSGKFLHHRSPGTFITEPQVPPITALFFFYFLP